MNGPALTSAMPSYLATLVAAFLEPWRARARQRALAALSDRQLRDAGIDLSLAGRGRAAAASPAILPTLASLS
jgi:uncharacterized protein YjiS (DUF1127 family)